MRLLYNRILKNRQVNVGNPYEISFAYRQDIEDVREALEEQACAVLNDDPEELLNEAREEAERQAGIIIEEARERAEKLLEEAEGKSLIIKEEARKAGFEEGLSKGKKQYEALLEEAQDVKRKAEADYLQLLGNVEADAIRMIMDIAKKVISHEMEVNSENVLLLVKQAFQKCTNAESAILKVSAEDYDYVSENRDKLVSMLGGVEELEIRKDFSLTRGACIVETAFGTVDAGIETKFGKIEEAFGKLIGNSI